VRIFAGLVVAAHGAQKLFGWQGGPGLERWTLAVGSMGFRPPRAWAYAAAYGEFVAGLLFAVGLFTGIAAGVLLIDMAVAIWKAHWTKGFWNTAGGLEYPLLLAVTFGVFGLMGPGRDAFDAALGLANWTVALFVVTLVVGLTGMWSSTRPA